MDFDFSWLSNLMGSGSQGTSALGGLQSMGDFSSVTAPAAQSAAAGAGVGNNSFGFSADSPGGLGTQLDPKMLQAIMSQANGGASAARSPTMGGGGAAPRGNQVQMATPTAAAAPAARMGLRQLIGG